MSLKSRKLILGLLMDAPGYTHGDWRRPDANPRAMIEINSFIQQAQECERGKLDFFFYSDSVATSWKSTTYMMNRLDPVPTLCAVAMATKHIGLIATISSTYTEPFNLARAMATLDHISNGRAGWNIVTSWSPDASANFGYDEIPKHKTRYQMADEHLDVCMKLWDSWEEGALVFDKKAGKLVDKDKMHKFNHKGEFYKVAGPLNISRMPQGYPVLFQAGASDDGRDYAVRRADAIFITYEDAEKGRAFYKDIKQRAAQFGRDPDKLYILPHMSPYIYSTEAEALQMRQKRADLVPLELAINNTGRFFGYADMSKYDPDAPFPLEVFKPEHMEGTQYHLLTFLNMVKREKLTLRQAAQRLSMPRGEMYGSPEMIADQFQQWFETGVADGFVLSATGLGQLEVFNNEVMPILRKRGIGREDYEGGTLRDMLGLEVPENQFTSAGRGSQVA